MMPHCINNIFHILLNIYSRIRDDDALQKSGHFLEEKMNFFFSSLFFHTRPFILLLFYCIKNDFPTLITFLVGPLRAIEKKQLAFMVGTSKPYQVWAENSRVIW